MSEESQEFDNQIRNENINRRENEMGTLDSSDVLNELKDYKKEDGKVDVTFIEEQEDELYLEVKYNGKRYKGELGLTY